MFSIRSSSLFIFTNSGCERSDSTRGSASIWKNHGQRTSAAPLRSAMALSVSPNATFTAVVKELRDQFDGLVEPMAAQSQHRANACHRGLMRKMCAGRQGAQSSGQIMIDMEPYPTYSGKVVQQSLMPNATETSSSSRFRTNRLQSPLSPKAGDLLWRYRSVSRNRGKNKNENLSIRELDWSDVDFKSRPKYVSKLQQLCVMSKGFLARSSNSARDYLI